MRETRSEGCQGGKRGSGAAAAKMRDGGGAAELRREPLEREEILE